MIVLRSQTEDRQCTPSVSLGLVLVLVPKKTSDGEFAAFDPKLRSFVDGAEGHESTVCGTDEAVWVFKVFDWTCRRLEFSDELSKVSEMVPGGNFEEMGLPIEKLVERFYKRKEKGSLDMREEFKVGSKTD